MVTASLKFRQQYFWMNEPHSQPLPMWALFIAGSCDSAAGDSSSGSLTTMVRPHAIVMRPVTH